MISIEMERTSDEFGFTARDSNGHSVKMDTSPETGGLNYGVRPMQLVLMALSGCSGIDIVAILKKQRQQVDGFRIKIDGEREQGKEPSLWKDVTMTVELDGDIDREKAEKAVALSIEKYCSVAQTLRGSGTNITWKVEINKNK
jgi:putative redox protein